MKDIKPAAKPDLEFLRKFITALPFKLTDDQMRALALKGGVAHTTLYHGFLRKDGEASIIDAMQHLDHAIDVMGIEHVGLGADSDGDGFFDQQIEEGRFPHSGSFCVPNNPRFKK